MVSACMRPAESISFQTVCLCATVVVLCTRTTAHACVLADGFSICLQIKFMHVWVGVCVCAFCMGLRCEIYICKHGDNFVRGQRRQLTKRKHTTNELTESASFVLGFDKIREETPTLTLSYLCSVIRLCHIKSRLNEYIFLPCDAICIGTELT